MLLDVKTNYYFLNTKLITKLGLKTITMKCLVNITFVLENMMLISVILNIVFNIGRVCFVENFTMWDLSSIDVIVSNTFLNNYKTKIRKLQKIEVVIASSKGSQNLFLADRPTLKEIGIDLIETHIKLEEFSDYQFKLYMRDTNEVKEMNLLKLWKVSMYFPRV